MLGDAAVVGAASYSGWWLELVGGPELWVGYTPHLPKALALAGMAVVVLYLSDLYRVSVWSKRTELGVRLAVAFALIGLVTGATNFLVPFFRFGRLNFTVALTMSAFGTFGWRAMAHRLLGAERLRERILIVGTGKPARLLLDELAARPLPEFEVAGILEGSGHEPAAVVSNGVPILGSVRNLEAACAEQQVDSVVVALAERRSCFPIREILACKMRGIRVEDYPDFLERLTGKIPVYDLRPSWLIFSDGFASRTPFRRLKWAVDLFLAAVLLVVAAPVMAIVAVAIRLESRGPALFRQERMGLNGLRFVLIKFRSMYQDAEQHTGPVWATEDDPRVTRVGRFIRKTRLDELPQLWNVLRGEMSFIGPRPERPHFVQSLQEIVPYYSQRLVVRPGITGWAQVRYQYGASVEDALEKLQYDLYYIKNMSLFLELLILLATVQVVLSGRGGR
jgi:sugar transferase (PEP-CTERM system associated)